MWSGIIIICFKFIYFNWRLITLQYCGFFCHTLTWISHACTCVPILNLPSFLPPHPIPLGHPSAPALNTLSHASNLDWWSVSHMVIYMFQCYTLRSSYPIHPPPPAKKKELNSLCVVPTGKSQIGQWVKRAGRQILSTCPSKYKWFNKFWPRGN